MLIPRASIRVSIGALALFLAVFGCGRRHDGGVPAEKAGQSQNPAPCASQSDTRSAPQNRAPASAVKSAVTDAGPPQASKLRGFRCTRELNPNKAPRGPLSLHFAPTSPTDFTIHVEFHCQFNCQGAGSTCNYSADLRAEHGVLRDALPGMPVRCTQSAEEPLAVDCGPLIGSDVETVVTARYTSRLVRFTLPPNLDEGPPDQTPGDASYGCLPFYERPDSAPGDKSINLNYLLRFSPDACELDP